ncbi:unnamed protein product, partial [marine sediment metagenome]
MSLILLARGGMARAAIRVRFALFAAALVAFACGETRTVASTSTNGIRAQDEIVLVNVRPVGGCCDPAVLADGVRVESYQKLDESGCRHWQASNLQNVAAADPSVSTVIFVHGNRLTNWDAKCEGLAAYRRIVRQSNDAPIRFVIYSWPSAQISGPLKD